MTQPPDKPPNDKHSFRHKARALRKTLCAQHPLAGTQAARLFLDHFGAASTTTIALYHSCNSELNTRPLAEALAQRQQIRMCLPVIVAADRPLIFRHYDYRQALITGTHDIQTPAETAPCILPDLVLVPLLAFQENGARLGQGGGYYDRTLQHLKTHKSITSVGYAYDAQRMPQFPVTPHDQYLDYIVTDKRVIHSVAIRKALA